MALAAELDRLGDGQYLLIASRRGWGYVQFARTAGSGMRAEAVSNRFVPSDQQMTADDLWALGALGWLPPDDLSPNHYRDWPEPVEAGAIAAIAVATLTDVFGVSRMDHLQYRAFDRLGGSLMLPHLGLRRVPDARPRRRAAASPPVAQRRAMRVH